MHSLPNEYTRLTRKCYQDYNVSNIKGGGNYAEPGGTFQSERDIVNDDASGLACRRFGGHANLDFRPAKVSPSPGVIASGLFVFHAVNQNIYIKERLLYNGDNLSY